MNVTITMQLARTSLAFAVGSDVDRQRRAARQNGMTGDAKRLPVAMGNSHSH